MTIHRLEIARDVRGPLAETEDWWRLCYDTESGEFFVEHQWDHANPYPRGRPDNRGTKRHNADDWTGPGSGKLEEAKALLLEQAAPLKR